MTTFIADPHSPRSSTLQKVHGATVRAHVDWSAYSLPIVESEWRGSSGGDVAYTAATIVDKVASCDVSGGAIGELATAANVVTFANGSQESFCLVIVNSRF